ncbi:MAG TPA: hypothetical protein VHZ50_09960 [Puia sp.]|nr:hypothetical protein [Puia sp.]
MEKAYKITYKTYYNERLNKSHFHNKLMYPLYIQVTFDRIPITFKSYFYDLYAKPKYAARAGSKIHFPEIKTIIKKEETLLEYIIDRNLEDFSLTKFKEEYVHYCRDLLDIMEADFLNYVYIFLHDEGMPFLADTIKSGAIDSKPFYLMKDMKRSMKESIYKKLEENSFYYAPPYLPLYAFCDKVKDSIFSTLTVMEWEQPGTKEEFINFFKKNYPQKEIGDTMQKIQKWIHS